MISDVLKKYQEYLKYELNYSENTIKEYFFHLRKYLEYLELQKLDYRSVNKDNIISFLKKLDNDKMSNKSISNILSSLRTFYNFLVDEKIITGNVFKLIRNPKVEKKLPNFLSNEEIRMIFDTIDTSSFLGIRNKLIVELLYATGMRVSELVNIRWKDIINNECSIRVYGKGKKERIVYYGEYAACALDQYIKCNPYSSDYVIVNYKGEQISSRGIEKIIDKIATQACIKNNISPHTFRHTFATHLLNEGGDIKTVQELLGHSSLNTTEVYTHITSDYLKSVYLKSMPRK